MCDNRAMSFSPLDYIRNIVRKIMNSVASGLNRLSGGAITPDMITYTSLLGHIPIVYLIAMRQFVPAAVLLVVFGLMDALDGALARLQNRVSSGGMLLDATTDRMKEILLYSGIIYVVSQYSRPLYSSIAVLAVGGSLLVSYVKAKGETALSETNLTVQQKNRYFQDGLLRYEVRMGLLVLGLLFQKLEISIVIIAVFSWFTAVQRLVLIRRQV